MLLSKTFLVHNTDALRLLDPALWADDCDFLFPAPVVTRRQCCNYAVA
jgi:hypothetical protein